MWMHSYEGLACDWVKLTDGGTTILGIEGAAGVAVSDSSPAYHPHSIITHLVRVSIKMRRTSST